MYRLVIGVKGNERGWVVSTNAQSDKGAKIALGIELAKYHGDAWGGVQLLLDNGEWIDLSELAR